MIFDSGKSDHPDLPKLANQYPQHAVVRDDRFHRVTTNAYQLRGLRGRDHRAQPGASIDVLTPATA